jgi:excisionase family DNA binding protein
MTVRAALAPRREGITVMEAAAILGCDPSTVRELLRIGELEGWRIGKTKKPYGVRVDEGSCYDYRARHSTVDPTAPIAKPRRQQRRPPRTSAAHVEALAALRARGVRI